MSENCETCEASISALIDGELPAPDQLPTVDHLLDCRRCRKFYRRARALGELVVSARSQEAEPAPEHVWERIVAESGMTARSGEGDPGEVGRFPRRLPRAGLQLAAGLVVATGLWFAVGRGEVPVHPGGESSERPATGEGAATQVDLVLEEDRGAMTDDRFLELVTEILKADRGYHRKMLEVMSVVTAMTGEPEGQVDERELGRDRLPRISLGEDNGEESIAWNGGDQL